jgi:hypothetical protein
MRAMSDSPSRAIGMHRVAKRLNPGQPGTRKLAQRFGPQLVCVRHRIDDERQCRYTTVELVIDTAKVVPKPDTLVLVRVDFEETELRLRLRRRGAAWDRERKRWILPRRVAVGMGLADRIDVMPPLVRRGGE